LAYGLVRDVRLHGSVGQRLVVADGATEVVIEGPDLELAAAESAVYCRGLRAGNRGSFKFVWISSISFWIRARKNFARLR
jgi:hypothetical protein